MVNREIMFEVNVFIINPQKGFASQYGQKGQENLGEMAEKHHNCTLYLMSRQLISIWIHWKPFICHSSGTLP